MSLMASAGTTPSCDSKPQALMYAACACESLAMHSLCSASSIPAPHLHKPPQASLKRYDMLTYSSIPLQQRVSTA